MILTQPKQFGWYKTILDLEGQDKNGLICFVKGCNFEKFTLGKQCRLKPNTNDKAITICNDDTQNAKYVM